MSLKKTAGLRIFSLRLLGTAGECTEYEASISAHRKDDAKMSGEHVQKFCGEPLAIDMGREMVRDNEGLVVGPLEMKNISTPVNDGRTIFGLTIDIKKK